MSALAARTRSHRRRQDADRSLQRELEPEHRLAGQRLAEPARPRACEHVRRSRIRHPDGGRLTLEQRLERAWEGLHAVGLADCPVCGAEMQSGAGGGRCGDCGAQLS